MSLEQKKRLHEEFWSGEGPCLLLIPAPEPENLPRYRDQVHDPYLMWVAQVERARRVIDWPTDGIPTIRANYGVVFLPSIAGQKFSLHDDQMPWPGEPLSVSEIRNIPAIHIDETDMVKNALKVYEYHLSAKETEIAPYLPDTQGIFDVAHLLWGHDLLVDLVDETRRDWVSELMDICLDLYVRVSQKFKAFLDESPHHMIHGHGTPQGVYFPHAGVRVSEDTATMLSPQSIQEWIIPYIDKALAPFEGGFAHFCGHHKSLFEQLCQCGLVRAIDVQPDAFDPRWLLERCAETGTVLYSGIAAVKNEDWRGFVQRIAGLIRETGARCIIRPGVFPSTREECQQMLDMWHDLTCR